MLRWLHAGAVVAGLGAAMATGQGVAVAEEAADSPAAETSDGGVGTSPPAAEQQQETSPASVSTGDGSDDAVGASAGAASAAPSLPSSVTTVSGAPGSPTSTVTAQTTVVEVDATAKDEDEDEDTAATQPVSSPSKLKTVQLQPEPETTHTAVVTHSPTVTTPDDHATGDAGVKAEPTTPAPAVSTMAMTATDQPVDSSALRLAPPPAAQPTLSTIVGNILSAFGIGAAPAPAVPLQAPLFWTVLTAIGREIQHFFFNQPPTVATTPEIAIIDGTDNLSVDLGALDAEGDPIRYRILDGPDHGTVTLVDGRFVYNPTDGYAGADSFTVAVTDRGFHLRGLLGLIHPAFANPTVTRVELAVTPPDYAPQLTDVTALTDPDGDGTYTGTFRVTDEGGPLTVTGTSTGGFVTVSRDEATGVYSVSYRPTDAMRLRAGQTADPVTATVAVTVTDEAGQSASSTWTDVPVTPGYLSEVSGELAEGPAGVLGLAVSPNGRIYFATSTDGVLRVFDANGELLQSVSGVGRVLQLVALPDGRVYWATSNTSNVQALNTDGTVATIPGITGAVNVAANADGSRVYVASTTGEISVIDTATNQIVAETTISGTVRAITVSADGDIYVVHTASTGHAVTVLDPSLASIGPATAIPTVSEALPARMIATPDGVVYQVRQINGLNGIVRADTTTGDVQIMLTGVRTSALRLSADGSLAYIPTWEDATTGLPGTQTRSRLVVVDTATNEVLESLEADYFTSQVAVSADGHTVYVSQAAAPGVIVRSFTFGSTPPGV